MTPQERELVAELFDRLGGLEDATRDREAEEAIAQGLRRAPHAVYPLVQTVLVQDEALKRADARIRELETALGADNDAPQGGFLDNMRETLFGGRESAARGSVPSVRPEGGPMGVPPGFRTAAQPAGYGAPPQEPVGQGGSFLGTAAATAAGVLGGAMMLQGIRSMFGERQGALGAYDSSATSAAPTGGQAAPWGGQDQSDLSRQAGIDQIGSGGAPAGDQKGGAGLFDVADDTDDDFDGDTDLGGDFGDDGDSA
jgi:hypothetical protein